MAADPHKLMIGRQATKDSKIVDLDMTGQGRTVGHHNMVADNAVMGNVGVGHEQVVAANHGLPVSGFGAAMHGH